jgi:hypothetical protein
MIRKFQEIIRNGHGDAQVGEPRLVPLHPSWLLAALPVLGLSPHEPLLCLPPSTALTYLSSPAFAQTPRIVDRIPNAVSGG